MNTSEFENFKERFKLLASKHPHIIVNTLSNIFSMRLIGNKTHGDLAEIGIMEFINQFMYDFKSVHVGKDRFRAKDLEEDILIINEITKTEIPVSLKAYGNGPLQLATDSSQTLFPFLESQGNDITDTFQIKEIFTAKEFSHFSTSNIMPLIYDERLKKCNIMVFDYDEAIANTGRILRVGEGERYDPISQTIIRKKGRKYPIYIFYDSDGDYICEVRYGGAAANALQRGLWTHTKNAVLYFNSLTHGWIDYSHNHTLVKLFRLALNSTEAGHAIANDILQKNIDDFKES